MSIYLVYKKQKYDKEFRLRNSFTTFRSLKENIFECYDEYTREELIEDMDNGGTEYEKLMYEVENIENKHGREIDIDLLLSEKETLKICCYKFDKRTEKTLQRTATGYIINDTLYAKKPTSLIFKKIEYIYI